MIKIIVIVVFLYNLMNTVSDPSAKSMILNIGLLAILLSLFITTGKKVVATIFKVVAIVAVIAYALIHFGII